MQYGDLKKVLQTCKQRGVVVSKDEMLNYAQHVAGGHIHMNISLVKSRHVGEHDKTRCRQHTKIDKFSKQLNA